MRPDLLARLAARQQAQVEAGLLRRLRTVADTDSPWLVIDGRRLLGFAGND